MNSDFDGYVSFPINVSLSFPDSLSGIMGFNVLRKKLKKMVIFVDMDEVLADTYGAHIEIYNAEFKGELTAEKCLGTEV